MSKSLRSYPEAQRLDAAKRRVERHAGDQGLGYWAAVAFLARHGVVVEKRKSKRTGV